MKEKTGDIDILEKMKIVNGKIENVTPIDAIFAISNLIAENKELKEKKKELEKKLDEIGEIHFPIIY